MNTQPTEYSKLLASDTKPSKTANNIYKSIIFMLIFILFTMLLLKSPYNRLVSSQVTNEIRGGFDASGFDYPWIASWRFDDLHCCTGSLIHQNPPIVVTAAHCVTCEQTQMDLQRTLTDAPDNDAETHNILYWIEHPDYGSPTLSSHDIALVVLDGTTEIKPIELIPPKISTRNVFSANTMMDIFGYGFIDEDDTIISTQLQEGQIFSWNKDECFNYLSINCDYGDRWDNDAMLCGYNADTSTERGDSGGPALMNGYLSGINSWSPPTDACESIVGADYKILDVFVDIGSVRHWIENTIPAPQTYIIGLHICDDSNADEITDNLLVILHGSNGNFTETITLNNPFQSSPYLPDNFNTFAVESTRNIGWFLNSITFKSESSTAVCIDMVVGGRLDGAELFGGSAERFWMHNSCDIDHQPCYEEYGLELINQCGSKSTHGESDIESSIDSNYYTMIIHVCDTFIAGSVDNIYARFHGVYDTTEWFRLQNNATNSTFYATGTYIFHFDAGLSMGLNIQSIDFQNDNTDALCIDMVTAGNALYPYYWKGNHDAFFIDSPCSLDSLDGIPCYDYHSVTLSCYDF